MSEETFIHMAARQTPSICAKRAMGEGPKCADCEAKTPTPAVESMPGFDSLSEHDKGELRKFEQYLRAKREPVQPIEGAYAATYGEVVLDGTVPVTPKRTSAPEEE